MTRALGTLLLGLLSPALLWGHSGHDIQGEVVWNAEQRLLECALRVPGVELETALTPAGKLRVDLRRDPDVEGQLTELIAESLRVTDYRDRELPIVWSGHRVEPRAVWLFFSIRVPSPTQPADLWWSNRLLFKQHADQSNTITFRTGEQTVRLTCTLAAPRHRLAKLPAKPVAQLDLDSKQSLFHGFVRHDFLVRGHKCILVEPHVTAVGRPWIWRARFFGVASGVDQALLDRGFHLAYIDVADLFGAPTAVARFDQFYDHLTEHYDLASRPVLEGLSRGGLIIYNWAIAHPERVACIYADAPVCDFRSWPLRHGPPAVARKCLAAYELTAEQATTYAGNPVNQSASLAKAGVPSIHVVGEADRVVPVAENTDLLARRYRQAGGQIQVLRKPGIGHHPHGLKDPQPIVDFILTHMITGQTAPQTRPPSAAASVPNANEVRHTPRAPRTQTSPAPPN